MTVQIKPGARFRSAVCDVEVIAVKAPTGEIDLRCGGVEMLPIGSAKLEDRSAAAGLDGGSQLGKRYSDPNGEIELLCTKGGASTLTVGDVPLVIKAAKPLPSSD